jgi:lipopolysaccharide biosynthesis glycosyltransferase
MSSAHRNGDIIHVVCIADANYGPYAGITLASVLGANSPGDVHVHLFSDGIDDRDVKRVAAMVRRTNAQFSLYDIKGKLEEIRTLPKRINHYTRASYGRLFFPEFLSPDITRAMYLDSDIICVSSLRELWAIGEGIQLLGAARDPWVDNDHEHKRALGMPEDHPYFNAGMLLINIEAWRCRNIGDRILEFVARPKVTKHADQDVINSALWKEITEVPQRWNLLITSPRSNEIPEQLADAANIHFCGGFKPWHFGYRLMGGVGAEAFRRAKAVSPWQWMLPDFQVNRVRRKLRQAIRI